MVYKINDKVVTKEYFESELDKKIENYIPFSQYYPKKEEIRDVLGRDRIFYFRQPTKHVLGYSKVDCFIAVEQEILDIEKIVAENENDPLDDDAFRIAVALYNAGYKKERYNENRDIEASN